MRSHSTAGVLTALLSSLLVAGCSETPGHGPAERVGHPFGGLTRADSAGAKLLHDAEERLVAECMSTRGFDYEPSESEQEDGPGNPYGILSPKQASDNGYGITMRAVRNASTGGDEQRNAARENRSPEWKESLTGKQENRKTITTETGTELTFSTDGCLHEARTELYGNSWDRAFYGVQDLSNEVIRRVTDSPDFSAAQRRWSECMNSAGYNHETLQGPLRTVQEKVSAQGPTKKIAGLELAVAEQDARCQQRVGLAETVRKAQDAAETSVLQGHGALLRELRKLRAAALTRARAVLEEK